MVTHFTYVARVDRRHSGFISQELTISGLNWQAIFGECVWTRIWFWDLSPTLPVFVCRGNLGHGIGEPGPRSPSQHGACVDRFHLRGPRWPSDIGNSVWFWDMEFRNEWSYFYRRGLGRRRWWRPWDMELETAWTSYLTWQWFLSDIRTTTPFGAGRKGQACASVVAKGDVDAGFSLVRPLHTTF
jgi:hypothetical protein